VEALEILLLTHHYLEAEDSFWGENLWPVSTPGKTRRVYTPSSEQFNLKIKTALQFNRRKRSLRQ